MRLSSKITVILALSLFPQAVIALFHFGAQTRESVEGVSAVHQFRETDVLARSVSGEMAKALEDLGRLSSLALGTSTAPSDVSNLPVYLLSSSQYFDQVFIVDKNGRGVGLTLSRDDPTLIAQSGIIQNLIQSIQNQKIGVAHTFLVRSPYTNRLTFFAATTLPLSLKVQGDDREGKYLIAGYSSSRLEKILETPSARAHIVDIDGRSLIDAEGYKHSDTSPDNGRILGTVVPLPPSGDWRGASLALAIESALPQPIGYINISIAMWFCFTLFSIALGVFVLIRYLSLFVVKPVESLRSVAAHVGEGDFNVRADTTSTSSDDEIQDFIRALNAALARVHHSYGATITQLQGRSRAIVEDEQLLQNLVESTSVGLIVLEVQETPQGMSVIRMNTAANSLLFNTSISNVQFLRADGGTVLGETLPRFVAQATGRSVVRSDLYVRGPDHSLRALSVSARPIQEGGRVRYIVLSIIDITEFRDAEKSKSDFVSLASHQLRTPVATINWYAELLLGEGIEDLNSDQRASITQIAESSRRLSKLVTALLDVSRAELGTLRHEEGFFDPLQALTSAISEVRPLAIKKRITIHESIDYAIPLTACGSKVGMIMFQNLLNNAVKYTSDGGDIWCELTFDESRIGFVFVVSDNGIGIPESEAVQIFTRFYRASNAKEVDATGSGLGLSITRLLAERAGGSIRFAPRAGGGTIFTIRLPFTCSI